MNIIINNEVKQLEESISVAALAEQMSLPAAGTAIAINKKVVSKAAWGETMLRENDEVIIIKAACGG